MADREGKRNLKKFGKILIALVIIIMVIVVRRVVSERRYLKKLEPPEWINVFEKNMTKTSQEIKVGGYSIKLVGVYYNSTPWKRNIEQSNEVEYVCKFEVTNPNVNMKKCIAEKTNVANEISPWFGENHDMRITAVDETGYLANDTYYRLKKDKLYVYSYVSVQKSNDLIDKDYYSTWPESIYLQIFPAISHRDGCRDMAGVFNLNIAGKTKEFNYEDTDLDIYVTEQNIYFHGDENTDIDSLVLHMKDGTTENVSEEMKMPEYCDDKFKISNYGIYETDENIKTFTGLIHFSEGIDIDNVDYVELNGKKLL